MGWRAIPCCYVYALLLIWLRLDVTHVNRLQVPLLVRSLCSFFCSLISCILRNLALLRNLFVLIPITYACHCTCMLVWFLLITVSSLVAIWSFILAQQFIKDTDLALVHTFAQIGGRVITCCYVYALLFKSLRLGLTHVIRQQGVGPEW